MTPNDDLNDASPTAEEVATCLRVLRTFAEERGRLADLDLETRRELLTAAGQVSRPSRAEQRDLVKAFRRREKLERKAADDEVLEATGVRALRREAIFRTPPALLDAEPRESTPADAASAAADAASAAAGPGSAPADTGNAPADSAGPELIEPRKCYVCKAEFRRVHFFYDAMCPACAAFNHAKRDQSAPLDGRVAIVTGARVKIGYQAAIKLLRAGARVVVTTRFPRDAAARYAAEPDFDGFRDRLQVVGIDLLHTPSVERLAEHLDRTLERLDFIIHNACQTVRRPPAFYAHMLASESAQADLPDGARRLLASWESMQGGRLAPGSARESVALALLGGPADVGLVAPHAFTQIEHAFDPGAAPELFPEGALDADLQQRDLRGHNSWRMTLAEVPTVELLEVHLVNAVAPFVLNAKLKPLMLRHRTFDKHIVHVSAMEGQFYRAFKTDKHPHTNMAKAALNMLTRTSADDYAKDGIYMNSVDTGWVTDEDPAAIASRKTAVHGFHPPLDIVDGAARICDPIFAGLLTGTHAYGQFFKDYAPTAW